MQVFGLASGSVSFVDPSKRRVTVRKDLRTAKHSFTFLDVKLDVRKGVCIIHFKNERRRHLRVSIAPSSFAPTTGPKLFGRTLQITTVPPQELLSYCRGKCKPPSPQANSNNSNFGDQNNAASTF
ncbi:hypothetical protein WAI453_006478 [Rhynchosporium graminicola]